MPPLPSPPFRLDLWDKPAPAGGQRVAFLAGPGGRAARDVVRRRQRAVGQSSLTFTVAPEYHALASLTPLAAVVRLTRFVPTGPDSFTEAIEEWRIQRRQRTARDAAGPVQVSCVPIADDLLDATQYFTLGSGGLASWGYRVADRTPTQVLTDVRDMLAAAGLTWIIVGTVTPTTPVSLSIETASTPMAIIQALVDALKAKGVIAEFQLTLAGDLSSYRLELVTQVASALDPLLLTTGENARELSFDEDALEQLTTVIPRGANGIDLRELQFRAAAGGVDGATGWITVEALDGAPATIVAVDGEFTGKVLFRELTGRGIPITDSSASPQRVKVAVGDLASGLAAGERLSFREAEDNAGARRFVTQAVGEVPVQVASTLTSPNRIRTTTHDLLGAGDWLAAANQLRDWTAERSQYVQELQDGTINEAAGTYQLLAAPGVAPQAGDWILFVVFETGVGYRFFGTPMTVTAWNGGTNTMTIERRYPQTQLALLAGAVSPGPILYRPVGTPMRILSSLVANNELTVDALTGPAFAADDVLEIRQRSQGTRLVAVTDPAAVTAARRKVGTVDLPECTGATNLIPNGDLAAWAGAGSVPPDLCSLVDVVGTVTITRTTAPEYTRYGGKSVKLDFAAGSSAKFRFPLFQAHPVAGAVQIAAAAAVLFQRFSGAVTLNLSLYLVSVAGVRTLLGKTLYMHAPDAPAKVDERLRPRLEQWYDAVITNGLITDLRDESLQLELERPPGASNPKLTVYVDAAMALQREGLPEGLEGGVRWEFASAATAMLTAAHDLLLERRAALASFTVLPLVPPDDLVLGRRVTLKSPALGLTRALRLEVIQEDLDALYENPTGGLLAAPQVTLERTRADVARLLAAQLAQADAARPDAPGQPADIPTLEVKATTSPTEVMIRWSGSPIVKLTIDGGLEADPPASPITVVRGPANSTPADYYFEARNADRTQVVADRVAIPPLEYAPTGAPKITAVTIANVDHPGDGGGEFDLTITVANMPGGTTYDWSATVIAGSPISGGSDSDTGVAIGSFPVTNIAGCQLAFDSLLQLTIEAWSGGVLQDRKTVTFDMADY